MTNHRHRRELHEERLLEIALEERLGGHAPPDLTERILEADASPQGQPQRHTNRGRTTPPLPHALATVLLLALGLLAWTARPQVSPTETLLVLSDMSGSMPNAYYLTNDVQYASARSQWLFARNSPDHRRSVPGVGLDGLGPVIDFNRFDDFDPEVPAGGSEGFSGYGGSGFQQLGLAMRSSALRMRPSGRIVIQEEEEELSLQLEPTSRPIDSRDIDSSPLAAELSDFAHANAIHNDLVHRSHLRGDGASESSYQAGGRGRDSSAADRSSTSADAGTEVIGGVRRRLGDRVSDGDFDYGWMPPEDASMLPELLEDLADLVGSTLNPQSWSETPRPEAGEAGAREANGNASAGFQPFVTSVIPVISPEGGLVSNGGLPAGRVTNLADATRLVEIRELAAQLEPGQPVLVMREGRVVTLAEVRRTAEGIVAARWLAGWDASPQVGDHVLPLSRDQVTSTVSRRRAAREQALLAMARAEREAKLAVWRKAKATPNAARLMVGDLDELPPQGMQANVVIDGFRARVVLDCYFHNDRQQQLEGSFRLRLPDEASLFYFAFGQTHIEFHPQSDQLAAVGFLDPELVRGSNLLPSEIRAVRGSSWDDVKEARMVPREKAAHAYGETVRRRVDPALVEWTGAGIFQAKVFPLMPGKLHRIVIGYEVNLRREGLDWHYTFDLPAGLPECRVDVSVANAPGVEITASPDVTSIDLTRRPRRRYFHYERPAESVRVKLSGAGDWGLSGEEAETGAYFAAQVSPELPAVESRSAAEAVFLLDTSLSSRPEKFNLWLALLERTLSDNRDSLQRFGLLTFNLEQHWWQPEMVTNTPENTAEVIAWCQELVLEGATDLHAALWEATHPSWEPLVGDARPARDIFLLSDGHATWGESDPQLMAQVLHGGGGQRLFAYRSGIAGTAGPVLELLARDSGGAVFSVTSESEIAAAATAHRQRPWELLGASGQGLDDLLLAGNPRTLYPGQRLLIAGRGRLEPGAAIMFRLRQGEVSRTLSIPVERVTTSDFAPRLFGQVAVEQLDELQEGVGEEAIAFARHFRITGRSCSLLMLESEADYERFAIGSEDDAALVRGVSVVETIAAAIDALGVRLASAKARFQHWLGRLEQLPDIRFALPEETREVVDRLPEEAFSIPVSRLEARARRSSELPAEYLAHLERGELDYDQVTAEAARRRTHLGSIDGLRALSSLIENNPGDPILARDIAFTALQWGMGGQAYGLLCRVAEMRPHEPHTYLAIARCLVELDQVDLAMLYYDVVLGVHWPDRYGELNRIAKVEYLRLLRRIGRGEAACRHPDYAETRLRQLSDETLVVGNDLVVVMMWNLDRTDIDLHVTDPTGEECYYSHPETKAGGRITADVTEGYGPEMFTLAVAPPGNYEIAVNYYGSDANRTQARARVSLRVYRRFGTDAEEVREYVVPLTTQAEKRTVATIEIEGEN